MPFGGNDWLALTQEKALEPELPICDVPRRRSGGDAPRGRSGVRAGAGRGQRQRALRPRPGGRRHCGPRQPEPGRPRGPRAGGLEGGQPQPLPRHPPFRDVGSPPRGGEHGCAQDPGAARQRAVPRRRARAGEDGLLPRGVDVLPADARAGGLRQGRPRPTHHLEPHRRPAAGRPLRQ